MRYDAFISYSHAADGKLAPAIQRGLRRLARPWNRRFALRVFRDDTGLSVTASLWPSIEEALNDSDYFVLLASEESAQSEWVDKEIRHWLDTRGASTILVVLTSGEWHWDAGRNNLDFERSTAAPRSLDGAFDSEPRHLDLRWAREGAALSLRIARFRDAIADLAAPIHGVPKDELDTEDLRQFRKTVRLQRAAIAGLIALTLLSIGGGIYAVMQQLEAERQARSALARQLAIEARSALEDGEPGQSLLYAIQSLEVTRVDGDFIPGAETRLYAAIAELAVSGADLPNLFLSTNFSRDGYGGLLPFASSFDGRADRLAVAGAGNTIRIYDLSSDWPAEFDGGRDLDESLWPIPLLAGYGSQAGSILAMDFSPDGRWLAAAGVGGGLEILGAATLFAERLTDFQDIGAVTAVAFMPDGGSVVVGDRQGRVRLLGIPVPAADPATLADHGSTIAAVSLSRDGRSIMSTSTDGTTYLYSNGEGSAAALTLQDSGSSGNCAAISPAGDLVAVGGDSGIRVWRSTEPGSVARQMLVGESVTSLEFSADGGLLAAGLADGGVFIFEMREPDRDPRILVGHDRLISSLSFSDDGRWLVSTSYDRAVRRWPVTYDDLTREGCRTVALALAPEDLRIAASLAATADADGNSLLDAACSQSLSDTASRLADLAYTLDENLLETAVRAYEFASFLRRLQRTPDLVTVSDPSALEAARTRGRARIIELARRFAGQGDVEAAIDVLDHGLAVDDAFDLLPDTAAMDRDPRAYLLSIGVGTGTSTARDR